MTTINYLIASSVNFNQRDDTRGAENAGLENDGLENDVMDIDGEQTSDHNLTVLKCVYFLLIVDTFGPCALYLRCVQNLIRADFIRKMHCRRKHCISMLCVLVYAIVSNAC